MRSELIQLYRKASPRTGRSIEFRWVPAKQLKKHLAAGWKLKVEEKPEVVPERIDPKPEPESGEEIPAIPPSKLTEAQKSNIRIAEGTQKEIAKKFNVTTFTVSRIKNGKIK